MVLNTSVAGLSKIRQLSSSPFMKPSIFSISTMLSLTNIMILGSRSSFIHSPLHKASLSISNSKFSQFLDSTIVLKSADALSGKIDQSISSLEFPISSDFTANNVNFINNKSPFYGAAIYAELSGNPNTVINSCNFRSNSASIGGAISFYSEGELKIEQCQFLYNNAEIASDIFISNIQVFGMNNSNISESQTAEETILFIKFGSASINNSKFVNNKGLLTNKNAMNINLENDCFYQEFDNNNRSSISSTNEFINGSFTGLLTMGRSECLLVPYSTLYATYGISSTPAVFSLVAIFFFVIISITGILIVVCEKKHYGSSSPKKKKKHHHHHHHHAKELGSDDIQLDDI